MFRSRVLLVALSVLAATAVHAQTQPTQTQPKPTPVLKPPGATPPPAKPSAFDEIDTNHDGFISRDEFLAAQKKRFNEFDTNHDGKIDAKEIASSPPLMERNVEMAERMIKQWDSNGDGIVTAEEFKKFSEDRFAKQDKDGTGKIPRPTPPTAMRPPGAQGPQQKTELKVLPAPQPQPQPKPQPPPQH